MRAAVPVLFMRDSCSTNFSIEPIDVKK